jgi:hypothetical protein
MCTSRIEGVIEIATPNNDPRVAVHRVIDATELAYLRMNGNYGSNSSRSGKDFSLTLAGSMALIGAPMNVGSTITEATLPTGDGNV